MYQGRINQCQWTTQAVSHNGCNRIIRPSSVGCMPSARHRHISTTGFHSGSRVSAQSISYRCDVRRWGCWVSCQVEASTRRVSRAEAQHTWRGSSGQCSLHRIGLDADRHWTEPTKSGILRTSNSLVSIITVISVVSAPVRASGEQWAPKQTKSSSTCFFIRRFDVDVYHVAPVDWNESASDSPLIIDVNADSSHRVSLHGSARRWPLRKSSAVSCR